MESSTTVTKPLSVVCRGFGFYVRCSCVRYELLGCVCACVCKLLGASGRCRGVCIDVKLLEFAGVGGWFVF